MDRNPERNFSRLNPRLSQLYFYLTKGCNLRCRHCWLSPKHQTEDRAYPEMKVEHFKKALEQAIPLGLSRVKLTGGEPLMHSSVEEILSIVASSDVMLGMETNGVLCDSKIAQKIAKCKKPFVAVSLDAAESPIHESIRGVKGCFESAIKGIKNLTGVGINVQIIMTVMRSNREQIETVIELAESLKVKSVKFNVLQPTGRGETMHQTGEALSIEEIIKLSSWVETDLAAKTKLRLAFDHPSAFIPLEKIIEGKQFFILCDVLGALGVISTGHYAMCGVGENMPDMIFGHVDNDSLEDVWSGNTVLNRLRLDLPGKLTGICQDCLLNDLCMGACIAQNYVRTRDLWSANWFCQDAADAGLFPQALRKSADLQGDDAVKRESIIRRLESLKIADPMLFYMDAGKKSVPEWVEVLDEIFN